MNADSETYTDGHMKLTTKGKHTKKSSSSGPTALSPMPQEVLDLGRALVKELGLDPGVDTLSRWMAHYIAELIEEAESAKVEEQPSKLANCADTILRLWERRHQLPNGKRPFEDFEPILRAIESLNPEDDTPRYFRSLRLASDEIEKNEKIENWLKIADGLDYTAKVLITYCLVEASQKALDKSKKWVVLAKTAGLEDGIELPVIQFIKAEGDLTKVGDPNDKARRLLENRINRLAEFKKMANTLESDLRRRLKKSIATKAINEPSKKGRNS